MPRTRSLAWSELKIGLLTIAAIVIAAATILLLSGQRGFFWQRYSLKAQFKSIEGLKPGSPVRVAGMEVGSVKRTEFDGDKVDVIFEVNKAQRERITDRSRASLGSVSLLGENAVDITASSDGTPIPDWGYVPTAPPKPTISDLTKQASEGIGEIAGLVQDIKDGRGTFGKLMTEEDVYNELRRFVASASEVSRGIQQGHGTIGKLVNDPSTARTLDAALANMDAITRQINSGEGSLGKLLKDDAFSRSLTGASSNLEELIARLNRGEGTAGKLVTDTALYNRLNDLADRFDQVLNRLNEGQGTAGQLLNNKELYENMNKAVAGLNSLIADIRRDPRKFLHFRISIF